MRFIDMRAFVGGNFARAAGNMGLEIVITYKDGTTKMLKSPSLSILQATVLGLPQDKEIATITVNVYVTPTFTYTESVSSLYMDVSGHLIAEIEDENKYWGDFSKTIHDVTSGTEYLVESVAFSPEQINNWFAGMGEGMYELYFTVPKGCTVTISGYDSKSRTTIHDSKSTTDDVSACVNVRYVIESSPKSGKIMLTTINVRVEPVVTFK
jgi:WD40 repeat protein